MKNCKSIGELLSHISMRQEACLPVFVTPDNQSSGVWEWHDGTVRLNLGNGRCPTCTMRTYEKIRPHLCAQVI